MKQPKFTAYHSKGTYSLTLGNGNHFKFSSKKDAEKFCSEVEKFILQSLIALNLLQVEVYRRYRENYFLFYQVGKNNYLGNEIEIKTALRNAEDVFDRLVRDFNHPDAAHYTFKDAQTIAQYLIAAQHILIATHKVRSETQDRYALEILLSNTSEILRNVNTYGTREADSNINTINPSLLNLRTA